MIKHRTSQSFTDRALPVYFIHTENADGRSCYFLLRTSKADFRRLMSADDSVDIDAYGEILASGFGEKPSEYVCELVKDRYNITLPN